MRAQRLYRGEDSVVNNKATQTYGASMLQSRGDLGRGRGVCWSEVPRSHGGDGKSWEAQP